MNPPLPPIEPQETTAQFRAVLEAFVDRIRDDRNILACVLVGSINETLIWRKDTIGLWIIETDGVTKRVKSDGNNERIFRTLVEDGINIHAELIPRFRFKQMVEGSSRTAFSCNFFAVRDLVYCNDASIAKWLVDNGHSVIVIEHNLDVIKTADHIIDLGPEGGHKGGKLLATGTPEQVAKSKKSHTGKFLKRCL